MAKDTDSELIFNLLKQTTKMDTVKDFLKSKRLHHSSGSWEELYSKRIVPALIDGGITTEELIDLLRKAEEFGRQHTFLFKCTPSKAADLMDAVRVKGILGSKGLTGLLTKPAVLDQPETATISDIRWEGAGSSAKLLVKIVEQRRYERLFDDRREGNTIIRKYELVFERGVNIVQLHADGLLELRITSHSNSSNYENDLVRLWSSNLLFDAKDFQPISLYSAKQKLWSDQKSLSTFIRYSNSTLKNDQGNSIKAASGGIEADLADDSGMISSVEAFMEHDGFCDASNIWFKKSASEPTEDVHMILSGQINEFTIPAHCNKENYEYVLKKLRSFNS